jgi:hypothetical protein
MWIPFARIACPGSFPLPAGLYHSRRVLIAVNAACVFLVGTSWMTQCQRVHVCLLLGWCIARCQLSHCHLCSMLLGLAASRSVPLRVLRPTSPWDRACLLIVYKLGLLLAIGRCFAVKPHSHVICCLGQSTHIKIRDCIMYSAYVLRASD